MRTDIAILMVAFTAATHAADLRWSRYLGSQAVRPSMTRDAQGNVYVAGSTRLSDYPVTPGVYQPAYRSDNCRIKAEPCSDLFVTKFDPSGGTVWSTYLGTPEDDLAAGIAVDPAGNVFVAAALCTTGCGRGFIAQLSPSGDRVLATINLTDFTWPSMLPGAIAADASGGIYLATTTTAEADVFLGKLNAAGDGFAYTKRLGGSALDRVHGLAVSHEGDVLVVGQTTSTDFPTTPDAFQPRLGGWYDGFVVLLDSAGRVRWSSYVGGAENDNIQAAAFAPGGRAYVAGFGLVSLAMLETSAPRFVPLPGVHGRESIEALAVVPDGRIVIGGRTASRDLCVTHDAIEPIMYAYQSGYVSVLDANGSEVLYSTYLGLSGKTYITDIEAGPAGELYITGENSSTVFPVTTAFEHKGGGFVALLDPSAAAPVPRIRAIVNAASFTGGPLVRGELISIFGEDIGPETAVTATVNNGFFPTRLGAVEVLIDGAPVPLLYVSRTQVNAAVPMLAAHAVVEVVVRGPRGATPPFRLDHYPAAIGVFTLDGSGRGQAAALNQDNTLNSPQNPAKRGTIMQIWVTGAGLTKPSQPDGRISPPDDRSALGLPSVTLGRASTVLAHYAGAAPGMITGVAQINFRIPGDAPVGPVVRLSLQHAIAQDVTVAIAE